MEAAPLRLWVGAVLAIGGVVYALFVGPVVGLVACLLGIAILLLARRAG